MFSGESSLTPRQLADKIERMKSLAIWLDVAAERHAARHEYAEAWGSHCKAHGVLWAISVLTGESCAEWPWKEPRHG